MKKLYHHKIHPSPPPPTHHHLSLLPLAVATLAATLPPEDQQVLAYLLSISSSTGKLITNTKENHSPQFNCNCFKCYTSFWVRWDASPNQKLIHEIIDTVEDGLLLSHTKKNTKNKKQRKNLINNKSLSSSGSSSSSCSKEIVSNEVVKTEVKNGEDEILEKGSVRKIASFIGERIWGVWGV